MQSSLNPYSGAYGGFHTQSIQPENRSVAQQQNLCQLFVGGIPPKVTKDQLRAYFSKFGPLKECRMIKDKNTRRRRVTREKFRGFCFVTYLQEADAERALAEKEHMLGGGQMQIKRAWDRETSHKKILDEKERKVFVVSLPHDITEDDLRGHFRQFGERILPNIHALEEQI